MPRKPPAPPRPAPAPAPAQSPQQMSLFASGSALPDAGPPSPPTEERIRLARPTLWQVHDRYLLAETRAGLVVVDQAAAHQRVLYEEALAGFGRSASGAQRLLFPLSLSLPQAEHAAAEALAGLLAGIGFDLELQGGHTLVVHAVPSPHPEFDAERCLRSVLTDIAAGSPLLDAARSQHQRVALSYAAHAAIRPGQRLSQQEMGELFDRLFATSDPYRDLQGRPTVVQLSLGQLEEWFQ